MTLTNEELAVLKAKAEAATEGPWFDIDFSLPEVIGADKKPSAQDIFVSCCYPDPITVATMHGGFEGWESVEQAKKDAAFIAAANPATVLSLISTITQLRARAEAAELKGWNEAIEAAHREADLEWWVGDRHRTSSAIGPVICSKIRALKKETN